MQAHELDTVGRRIAHYRKLRHLTQRGLAERSNLSYSSITHYEQGKKHPSPSAQAAIARALAISAADLAGQPYLSELQQDQLDSLIQPIRWALDVYDLGPDTDIAPRPLPELQAAAERLCRLIRATDLRTAAVELPPLTLELTTAAHQYGSDAAWVALASVYRTAYDVGTKLGFHDLASIALDRMAWAAERGSAPLVSGIRQYLRALIYLRTGQYRTGRRLIEVAHTTADDGRPGRTRDVVMGQLHLGGSVLAARDRDGDAVEEHLAAAQRYADRTGEAAQVHWLSFGPFNVAAHRISTLVDRDLHAQALTVARTAPVPADWPASRAAHHQSEIARAQLWTGRTDEALRSLAAARRLAPQQTRYSPSVRQTVAGLVAARRAAPDTLANFASWVGM